VTNLNKYIVITSIFEPSKAIKLFSKLKDWKVVVVADKKTPSNWKYKNVIFLSVEDQKKLPFRIIKKLPWNCYSRKMIGYLYAMMNGADIIAESDDDNEPIKNWGALPINNDFDVAVRKGFINVYKYFTNKTIWPRGFPLEDITKLDNKKTIRKNIKIGVWQFLANGSPDVDAIYRLVDNSNVIFNDRKPLVLSDNSICLFNSQNTFFKKETFPLMYLPSYVSFRSTDIFRGLIAQPIMWSQNCFLGFGKATVIQNRNKHNLLNDFKEEIPVYLNSKKIVDISQKCTNKNISVYDNLISVYKGLYKENLILKEELGVLKDWIIDVKKYAR
jgi:hypothetical protein